MADMDRIYRQYSGRVFAFLYRRCGNEELAKELTQETFYRAVKSIDRFDGKSSVSTWLCGIAKHLYADALRKRRPTEELPEDVPSGEDFTEEIAGRDQAMIAHGILHGLEEPYREVFTLKTFCDLNHSQIAGLYGKTESWSRVTYYRARQMIQEKMREKKHEEE